MEFKITDEQRASVLQAFYAGNCPVQIYDGVKKLLESLPPINPAQNSPNPTEHPTTKKK